MDGEKKNKQDNENYNEGYRDGRDGKDPLKDIVDGFVGRNQDPIYRSAREQGFKDRVKYGKRVQSADKQVPVKDKVPKPSGRANKSGRQRSSDSSPGLFDGLSLLQATALFLVVQVLGSAFLLAFGPSLLGAISQPNCIICTLGALIAGFVFVVLMILLLPGTALWAYLSPGFVAGASAALRIGAFGQ